MDKSQLPEGIPKEGFIKLTSPEPAPLSPDQKSVLIRRGNSLLGEGDVQQAKRIFITIGYQDGMVRVGEKLAQDGEILAALQLFYMAREKNKARELITRMADVVRFWLRSDE